MYKYPYFYNWIFPYISTFVIRNGGIGGAFEQITDSIICTAYHYYNLLCDMDISLFL